MGGLPVNERAIMRPLMRTVDTRQPMSLFSIGWCCRLKPGCCGWT